MTSSRPHAGAGRRTVARQVAIRRTDWVVVALAAAALVWSAPVLVSVVGAQHQEDRLAVVPKGVERPDWTPMLPLAPGRDYAIGLCSGCHSVARLVLQKRSAARWHDFLVGLNTTVTTGGELCACVGGPLDDGEIETLTRYLSRAFGPTNPVDQLPLNLNTATAAAMARLPMLTADDVQRLIEARSRKPLVTRSEIQRVVGAVKFARISTFVDVKDSLFELESAVPR
jgi:hypothetical protein